ncbi:hypothetical protein POM88_054392 [Heracleum sosnowskyi]|uniref:Reverse transcriptase zinc-binding domain-containing protein n=1 Tax=Heracleum sosnowskyi TaxID=360622 RepID=A0AAD8LWQ1_9APIA|nr:hypothetical protein POM88_054392 [Heracleum sosnowskyi]
MVLDLRCSVTHYITYVIGNGQHTSLWYDPWHNGVPFCTRPDDPLISHSGLSNSAPVSCILNTNGWSLPSSNYPDLIMLRQNFQYSTTFNLHKTDDICWNGIASKRITVTDLWRGIRHVGTSVPWATCVWHRIGVPRYSFLHWLIIECLPLFNSDTLLMAFWNLESGISSCRCIRLPLHIWQMNLKWHLHWHM